MTGHRTGTHANPRRQGRRSRRGADGVVLPPAIVERPDGYYWLAEGGLGEIGPFATHALALADRDAGSDEALAPGLALQEAERDLGMAGWLDEQTGEPAEGPSPPHLDPT